MVLIGDVVTAADGREVIVTLTLDSDGGDDEVGGSTRSRADSLDTLQISVALVLVGNTVLTTDRVVDFQASTRIGRIITVSRAVFESRVSGGIADGGSRAETI